MTKNQKQQSSSLYQLVVLMALAISLYINNNITLQHISAIADLVFLLDYIKALF